MIMNSARTLTIPISSGSEPEPIEIDDATEAIGMPDDPDFAYFDDDAEPCEGNYTLDSLDVLGYVYARN